MEKQLKRLLRASKKNEGVDSEDWAAGQTKPERNDIHQEPENKQPLPREDDAPQYSTQGNNKPVFEDPLPAETLGVLRFDATVQTENISFIAGREMRTFARKKLESAVQTDASIESSRSRIARQNLSSLHKVFDVTHESTKSSAAPKADCCPNCHHPSTSSKDSSSNKRSQKSTSKSTNTSMSSHPFQPPDRSFLFLNDTSMMQSLTEVVIDIETDWARQSQKQRRSGAVSIASRETIRGTPDLPTTNADQMTVEDVISVINSI
jgi:hypothetical protein